MAVWGQLRLLLHKNFLLRTRQPVILSLEVLWPVAIVLIVLCMRQAIPPKQQNNCYYNARALPSAGALPFLQSLLCNIDNDCLNSSSYEEIPSYKEARVDELVSQLSPLLSDEEITNLVKALPKGVNLMRAVIDTLSQPRIQELLEKGLPLQSFLKDASKVKDILLNVVKIDSPAVAEALTQANISIPRLLQLFGEPGNLNKSVCNPTVLQQYLVLNNSTNLKEISTALCGLDAKSIAKLIDRLQKEMDGGKVIRMMSNLISNFGRPDVGQMLDDVASMMDTIFSLPAVAFGNNTSATNVTRWLPRMKSILQTLKTGEVDFAVISDIAKDIEPILSTDKTGKQIKHFLKYFTAIVDVIKKGFKTTPSKELTLGSLIQHTNDFNPILRNVFTTETLQAILDSKIRPEMQNYLKELKTPKEVYETLCKRPGIVALFDYSDSAYKWDSLKSFQDSLCVLFINSTAFAVGKNLGNYQGDEPVGNSSVSSLFSNTTDIINTVKDFSENLDHFQTKYLFLGQRLADNLLKLFQSNTFNSSRFGEILHITEEILKNFDWWPDFDYGLSISYHLLNISISQAVTEFETNLQVGVDAFWPYMAESLMLTLSDEHRWHQILNLSHWPDVMCKFPNFTSNFIVPEGVDAHVLQNYTCDFIGRKYQELFDAYGRHSHQNSSASRDWGFLVGSMVNLYNLSRDSLTRNFLREYKWERLDKVYKQFVKAIWGDVNHTRRLLTVLRSYRQIADWMTHASFRYASDFKALFYSLHKFLELMNRQIEKMLAANVIKASHIGLDLPTYTKLAGKFAVVLPDAVRSAVNTLKDPREFLSRVSSYKGSFSKLPCHKGSVSDLIKVRHENHVVELEKLLCQSSAYLTQELFQEPTVANILNTLRNVSKGMHFDFDWSEMEHNVVRLVDNFRKLSNFSGQILPNVEDFNIDDFHLAVKHANNTLRSMKNSTDPRFIFSVLDGILLAMDNTMKVKKPTFATLQWNPKKLKELSKNTVASLKFVIWATNEMMEEVIKYMQKLQSSDLSMYDLLNTSLLRDLWELLMNLPSVTEVVIRSLFSPAFSDIIEDFLGQNITNSLCASYSAFEQIVPFGEDHKALGETFFVIVCQLSRDTWQETIQQVWAGSAFSSIVEKLSKAWYSTNPATIPVRILDLYDKALQLQEIILKIMKNPPKFTWGAETTLINATVWRKFGKATHEQLKQASTHRFAVALQPLVTLLDQLNRTAKFDLSTKLEETAPLLSKVNFYLRKFVKEAGSRTLLETVGNDSNISEMVIWADKYLVQGVDAFLYTFANDTGKLSPIFALEKPIGEIICDGPLENILSIPDWFNKETLKEGQETFCNSNWTSFDQSTMKLKRNESVKLRPRNFVIELSIFIDLLINSPNIFNSADSPMLQEKNWMPVIEKYLSQIGASGNGTEWILPTVQRLEMASKSNPHFLQFLDHTFATTSCTLSKVIGGLTWNHIILTHTDRPNILSFLRLLARSTELVQVSLNTVSQVYKMQTLIDDFIISKSKRGIFCSVRDKGWDKYFVVESLEQRNSLFHLQNVLCNTNYTAALVELNPAVFCSIMLEKDYDYPITETNLVKNFEMLYTNVSATIRYVRESPEILDSKSLVKFTMPWQNTSAWFHMFQRFGEQVSFSFKNFTIQNFPSWLRVVGIMFDEVPESWPAFHYFHAVIQGILNSLSGIDTDATSIALDNAFPNSPHFQHLLKLWLPRLPDLVETTMWSLMASGKLLPILVTDRQTIVERLCKNSLQDYFYNPRLKSKDWAQLKFLFCDVSYRDVYFDLQQLFRYSDILRQKTNQNPVNWASMTSDLTRLMSILEKLTIQKPFVDPGSKWVNPKTWISMMDKMERTVKMTPTRLFMALSALITSVNAAFRFGPPCAHQGQELSRANLTIRPEIYNLICTWGDESTSKDIYQGVETILQMAAVNAIYDEPYNIIRIYQAILNITQIRAITRVMVTNGTLDKWDVTDALVNSLDVFPLHFPPFAKDWQVVINRSLPIVLKVVGAHLQSLTDVTIPLKVTHSVVTKLLEMLNQIDGRDLKSALQHQFPESPVLRSFLESILPHAPSIVTTLVWTAYVPRNLLEELERSHGDGFMGKLCNDGLSDYFFNPALSLEDWEKLQKVICQHDLRKLKEELLEKTPSEEFNDISSPSEWESLGKDAGKFLMQLIHVSNETSGSPILDRDQLSKAFSQMITLARNPEVVAYIVFNNGFAGFCGHDVLDVQSLPDGVDRDALHRFLCNMSNKAYAAHFARGINKLTKMGTDIQENRPVKWEDTYSAVLDMVKFKEFLRYLLGETSYQQILLVERYILRFVKSKTEKRSPVEELENSLRKGDLGRTMLQYTTYVQQFVVPTLKNQLSSSTSTLSLLLENSTAFKQYLSKELDNDELASNLLQLQFDSSSLLDALFGNATNSFCSDNLTSWVSQMENYTLTLSQIQEGICQNSSLLQQVFYNISIGKLITEKAKGISIQDWQEILDKHHLMLEEAPSIASRIENNQAYILDVKKLQNAVDRVVKNSKVLNAYKLSELMVSALQFVDKIGRYSPQWQTSMGYLRSILDAINYYLLSDTNENIYTILTNGTYLGRATQRLFGSWINSISSLSSHQIVHAISTMAHYYDMHTNDLTDSCEHLPTSNLTQQAKEVMHFVCKTPPKTWLQKLNQTYASEKGNLRIRQTFTILGKLAEVSPKKSQSRLKLFLHESNMRDLGPQVQTLVRKFVKAPLGFYRLEPDYWKPIPAAIWYSLPVMFQAQNELWCAHGNLTNKMVVVSGLVQKILSHIPDPEVIVCDLPHWSVTKVYRWISKTFELKKLAYYIHQLWSEHYDEELECATPLGAIGHAFGFIQKLSEGFTTPLRKEHIQNCMSGFYNTTLLHNMNKYGLFLQNISSLAQEFNFKSPRGSKNTTFSNTWKSISGFLSAQMPAFQPVSSLMKRERNLDTKLRTIPLNFTQEAVEILLNSSINLNWLARMNFSEKAVDEVLCQRKTFRPLLLLPISSLGSKRSNLQLALCQKGAINELLHGLDIARIKRELPELQHKQLLKGDWLEQLVKNVQSILKHILDLASIGGKLVNQFSSGATTNLLSSVVEILKENTVDKLLSSLHGLLEKIEPAIEGSTITEDLKMVLKGLQSLKSLQGLNLFNVQYRLEDVFTNKDSVAQFLQYELKLPMNAITSILHSHFDLSQVMNSGNIASAVRRLMCNSGELREILKIESQEVTFDDIKDTLCSLSSTQTIQASSQLLSQVAFSQIIHKFVDVGINGVLRKVNLTWKEAVNAVETLKNAPSVMPKLKQHMSVVTSAFDKEVQKDLQNLNISTEGIRLLGTPSALNAFGKILCGKALRSLKSEFRLLQVSTKEPKAPKLETHELMALPSHFCRNGYEQVMRMQGGPIIWAFLKPILRGKILYAPKNHITQSIFQQMNKSFDSVSEFINTLHAWGEGIGGLNYLQKRQDTVVKLKDLLNSDSIRPIIQQALGGNTTNILKEFNISTLSGQLQNVSGLLDLMQLVGNMSQCFELNRFRGYDTEDELELAAQRLSRTREFIAAVVFVDRRRGLRNKRDSYESFPKHVQYKLRMDIDNVPTTRKIQMQFWRPGPRDNFLDELRYFRGFVQYQEAIDRAIIQVHTGGEMEVDAKAYLQQMPYPCYQKDEFGYFLKGMLPLIMAVSWLFLVAFLIREFVLEKELQLDEILRVMGLKEWIGWLAWFLSGLAILSIGVIACVIILKLGGIFPYTDGLILFLFLMEYAVLVLIFCYLMSVFFKTATIAALTGIIIYLLTFMPFVLIIALETQIVLWEKLMTSLLVCTAFCYGCLYINRYEEQGIGLQWEKIWYSPIPGDDMNFMWAAIMIALDSLLYFLIAWYVSKVWPAHEARKEPWNFFLSSRYWGCNKKKNAYVQPPQTGVTIGYFFGQEIKSDGGGAQDGLVPVAAQKVGISIRGLGVVYNQGKTLERVAVCGLTMDLMEGHITTLLGQNGAGKTTTINVLTGQYPPTSGSVFVYGKHLPYEFSSIQKLLGYCPQYNTLFVRMTVREHLKFYAQLKGILRGKQLEDDIDDMLQSMGLAHMQHEQTRFLSGGMQRRLCVALAFIGGSKLIILDEPTSSVDPVARRSIWDLIVKYRHGRTILLTTHHMDEADILSDRVAIIHKGKLLCHGSPLLLKSKFGCGYQLTLARQGSESDQDSDSGRASSSCSDDSILESEDILTFVQASIPLARLMEDNGNEVVISLPQRGADGLSYTFSQLFQQLDANLHSMGFSGYGISSTTLEEVFLTLCGLEDNTALPVSQSEPLPMRRNSLKPSQEEIEKLLLLQEKSSLSDDSVQSDTWTKPNLDFGCEQPVTGMRLKFVQMHALLLKRYYHTKRDWRSIVSSILLPCMFIAIAMGFALIKPDGSGSKEPSLILSPPLYGPSAINFLSVDGHLDANASAIMQTLFGPPSLGTTCMKDSPPEMEHWCNRKANSTPTPDVSLLLSGGLCFDSAEASRIQRAGTVYKDVPYEEINTGDYVFNITGHDINDYLLSTYIPYIERRYGGWTFEGPVTNKTAVKIWYDNNGFHAAPAYLNSYSNAVLRANIKQMGDDPSQYGITTYNQPLQLTSEQLGRNTLLNRASELGIALVILLGFCFIPSSFIVYIVRERTQEEKRLQYVGGVGPFLYWFSALVWDLLLVVIAVAISVVIILIFSLPLYVSRLNLPAVIVLLLLFGWSMTPLMYLLEKLFQEASIAFMVLYCVNIFIGVNITIGMLIIGLFSFDTSIRDWLNILEYASLMFPQYALIGGLVRLAKNQIQSEVFAIFGQDTYETPFSMDMIAPHCLAMLCEGFAFFFINLLLEFRTKSCFQRELETPHLTGSEDSDVAEERKRVESDASKNDVLKIVSMKKVFHGMAGKNVAVDNVSFSIPKGECFGLLGVNGAGKTTLFRILTGHIHPTSGQAYVNNISVSDILSGSNHLLGYCPQADALDDLLTPEQHLIIYGKLRGIPKRELQTVVEKALSKFELNMYAIRKVGTLSRGTKRKVCTAISMLGNPKVVLLDEPTTGMDPVTRRLVWNNVLQTVKDQRSVLLTSHSMEECDVLCSRLAIMVNGQIRCLGSPQFLKYKFGTGYTISLRISESVSDLNYIMDFMSTFFPTAILRAHHYNMIEFSLPEKNVPLHDIFGNLEQNREKLGIKDFSISQTSLDQVFVSFARQQSDGIMESRVAFDAEVASNQKGSFKVSACNEAFEPDIKMQALTLENEICENESSTDYCQVEEESQATKF